MLSNIGLDLTAAVSLVAGWLGHAYLWTKVKVWINGAEAEAAKLKAQAQALEARVKKL